LAERETPETEVTLSTGKLLGIFVGLVVICSIFFSLGYVFGHGSAPTAKTEVIPNAPASGNSGPKPSAGNKNSDFPAQTCVAGTPNCPPSTTSPAASTPATDTPPPAQTTTAQKPAASSNPPSSNTTTAKLPDRPAGSISTNPPSTTMPTASGPKNPPGGTYMIQVAAVSKQEDAEILVAALRRKQYPAFVVSNIPGDPLFHIRVGPFTDPQEADAMRTRLVNDGYNAIVRK
jgi:DedD protein